MLYKLVQANFLENPNFSLQAYASIEGAINQAYPSYKWCHPRGKAGQKKINPIQLLI